MTTTQGSSSHNDIWLVVQKAVESFRLFFPSLFSPLNVTFQTEWKPLCGSRQQAVTTMTSHYSKAIWSCPKITQDLTIDCTWNSFFSSSSFFPPNQNGQSKPFLWKEEEDNFADWIVVLNVFELGKIKHMTGSSRSSSVAQSLLVQNFGRCLTCILRTRHLTVNPFKNF